MKKVINGLRYDTEKAVEVGSAGGGLPRSDFHFWSATLYRTPRSGRFFLAGEGGAMSRFSQSVGQNQWCGGADIIPLSRQEALAWAEGNLSSVEIEEHFSDMVQDA